MPTSLRPPTDRELAGAALAHPLALLLTERTVSALAAIAAHNAPATPAQRQLLRRTLAAIDRAELAVSARPA